MGDRNAAAQRATRLFGVISDTHGQVRQEALEALRGCERIIHAGDVGGQEVLEQLTTVAPVSAVRGNMDFGGWANGLPSDLVIEIDGRSLYVLHDPYALDLDPAAAGFDMVITGHTHRADLYEREGVVFLNPGSAGPRRHSRPPTIALLRISDTGLDAEIIDLDE